MLFETQINRIKTFSNNDNLLVLISRQFCSIFKSLLLNIITVNSNQYFSAFYSSHIYLESVFFLNAYIYFYKNSFLTFYLDLLLLSYDLLLLLLEYRSGLLRLLYLSLERDRDLDRDLDLDLLDEYLLLRPLLRSLDLDRLRYDDDDDDDEWRDLPFFEERLRSEELSVTFSSSAFRSYLETSASPSFIKKD